MYFSDDELVRKIKTGDTQSFDLLFRKYYSLLCIEAKGYFRNESLIEEIVCDVFTRIWQNREGIEISTSIREYLLRAVHNNCIDYYRIQKTQEKIKQAVDEKQNRACSLMDLGEDPYEYTICKELEENYKRAVETLPDRYRQAFKLSRFQGLSYEEIAVEMGISVNGVKLNLKKALACLRLKLSEFLMALCIIVMLSFIKNYFGLFY